MAIFYTARNITPVGGSSMLAIPPKLLKEMGNPSGFKFNINPDKSINLVPIYASVFLFATLNFMTQIAFYYSQILK